MQSFIKKSIEHVERIFDNVYNNKPRYRSYHFSIALERSKIIAVGLNNPIQPSPKALRFAMQLGLTSKRTFPFIHSEEDVVSKLIGMDKLSSSLNIVVIRLNKYGLLGDSLPCESCQSVLKAYGLNNIWYSTKKGEILSL